MATAPCVAASFSSMSDDNSTANHHHHHHQPHPHRPIRDRSTSSESNGTNISIASNRSGSINPDNNLPSRKSAVPAGSSTSNEPDAVDELVALGKVLRAAAKKQSDLVAAELLALGGNGASLAHAHHQHQPQPPRQQPQPDNDQ